MNKSATLTIEQWNLISHALGVAANEIDARRGVAAAEKYDTLSDHLTYDLMVTEEEPAQFVWENAE